MPIADAHLTLQELHAGLEHIAASPKNEGPLQLIVRRPDVDVREVLEAGELDVHVGLVGDTWRLRPSRHTRDGSPHPEMQLNIMNARTIALIAGSQDRWPLAGDQLFIELDLTADNLPAGTRLAIGGAVLEVTGQPHLGCAKFVSRFGVDAMKFVNSPTGRQYNLRGINAKVVQSGAIRVGDIARKVAQPQPLA